MPEYGSRVTPETRALLAEIVAAVPLDFGGGSSLTKALVFADLIAAFGIRDAVEIGVYRGRSLLPVAAVLRARGPAGSSASTRSDGSAGGEEVGRS